MDRGNDDGLAVRKKPQRGFWTMAQKRQAVAESHAARANVTEVVQRHGVRPALLPSWRRPVARMAGLTKKPAKIAAVRVKAPVIDGVIEIDLAGGCIRIRGIVEAQMLREALAAAR